MPTPDDPRSAAVRPGGRVPDRTFLFDLPASEARLRGQSPSREDEPGGVDRLDAEDLAFYQRVREGYLALSSGAPDRYTLIPSDGSIEETTEYLRAALGSMFGVTA